MSGLRSRNKGQRGEREVCAIVRKYGHSAKRTIQSRGGGKEVADCEWPLPFHPEIKYQEKINIWAAINQARLDSAGKLPYLVIFRRNQEEWHVTMLLEEFLKMYNNQLPCQTKESVEWSPSSGRSMMRLTTKPTIRTRKLSRQH